MEKSVKIQINLDHYTSIYRARVSADMISLRVVISAIKDGTYTDFSKSEAEGITYQSQPPVINQDLIDYEIIKAFISMIRNVNDYLDRMISCINFAKKKGFSVTREIKAGELNSYINELLDQELFNYCQKKREEMKVKLKYFDTLPQEFIRYMTTYSLLRNCYEHHKSISQRGIQIPIKKLALYTDKGKEVLIGDKIEGGTGISIKFEQKTINIKKGKAAILEYEDLASTEFYFLYQVPILIEKATNEIINNSKIFKKQ